MKFSSSNQPAAVAQPAPSAASQQQAPVQQPASQSATASGNAPNPAQDSFLSPENREKALRELTDMGFDRAQAELALRASFYHVERAAEYLITVNQQKKISSSLFTHVKSSFIQGNIPNFQEGPASNQGGESGQTPTGSESSAGGQRAGGRKQTCYSISSK